MIDHSPKPLIEDHYHIQDLIKAQEKRADDRQYYRNKSKARDERMADISAADPKQLKPFWCHDCQHDFLAESIKEVEMDWSCPGQYIAFYRTKCFKGHWCMRLITDVYMDGYWTRSKRCRADQGAHFADTLQPYQTGYNMLYKKI